jgi:hypothetical protein
MLQKGIDKDIFQRTAAFFITGFTVVIIYLVFRKLELLPSISVLDLHIVNAFGEKLHQLGYSAGGAAEQAVSGPVLLQRIILFFRLVCHLSPGVIMLFILGLIGLKSDKQYILLSFVLSIFFICFSMLFLSGRWIRMLLFLNPLIFAVIAYALYKVVFNLKDDDLFSQAVGGKFGIVIVFVALCMSILPVYCRKYGLNLPGGLKGQTAYLLICTGLFTLGLTINYFNNKRKALRVSGYKSRAYYLPGIMIVSLMFLQIVHYEIRNTHKYHPQHYRNLQFYTASYEEQNNFEKNIIGKINTKENIFLYINYNMLYVNYAMVNGLYEVPSAFLFSLTNKDIKEIFRKYKNVFLILGRGHKKQPISSDVKRLKKIKNNFFKDKSGKYTFKKIHKDFSIPIQIYKIEKVI